MPVPSLDEFRRRQIVEASLGAIASRGSGQITMREIARASGFSNGGLAHYFKTKEELFEATFREFYARIFTRAEQEMARHGEPLDQLLCFGAFFDASEPDVAVGYPLMFDCMCLAIHDRRHRALFEEWLDRWTGLLRAAIDKGVQAGVFADIDADAIARTISAIYQGLSVRWYLGGDGDSSEWATTAFREAISSLLAPYIVPAALRNGSEAR